jgi:hypothetical protein
MVLLSLVAVIAFEEMSTKTGPGELPSGASDCEFITLTEDTSQVALIEGLA